MSESDTPTYPVIVTYSNYGYIDFAKNLLTNLSENAPNHTVAFYCTDDEIYNELTNEYSTNQKFIFVKWYLDCTKEFINYGTGTYAKFLHNKFDIIESALKQHNFIMYIDCDVVCVKEPYVNYYNKYENYDVVFQTDSGDKPEQNNITVCAGIMLMRNNQGTQVFIDTIKQFQSMYPDKHDQECIHAYFKSLGISNLEEINDIKMICFPWREFMSGIYIKTGILPTDDRTYFIHANYVIGKNLKIHMLSKINKWYMKN